jgi:archaemetzincin
MKHIYVKTIGTVEQALVSRVREAIEQSFSLQSKVIIETEYPIYAFEPKRNQYYARRIIEKMVCGLPGDCEKVIGITDVDLCTPVLTFVYGEAQLGGNVAIVSFNRLKQEFYHLPRNDRLLCERLVKECIHELGHCYGLFHCSNAQCIMAFSSSILSIDNKSKNFCVGCKNFFDMNRKERYA